jgi:hypothetical protein
MFKVVFGFNSIEGPGEPPINIFNAPREQFTTSLGSAD